MLEKNATFLGSLKTASAWGLVAVILLLAFFISDILINFLAAFIFAIALERPIDKLIEKKISRKVAAISIYVIFLVVVGLISYSLFPPLAKEISNFAINLPIYLDKIFSFTSSSYVANPDSLNISQYLQTMAGIIGTSSQTIFGKIVIIFGGVASFFIIFSVSLFLNLQKNGVRDVVFFLVPKKHLTYANIFFNKMQDDFTGWLQGKTISSIVVAIMVYSGLLLIDIPYALVFAVLALVLNFIPFFGSIIAAFIPIIIGFTISFWDGVMVSALYIIINNIIEGLILMPLLMKRAINMNPVILIFFALVGGRLAGILGVIISIPIAAVLSLIVNELLVQKSNLLSDGEKV